MGMQATVTTQKTKTMPPHKPPESADDSLWKWLQDEEILARLFTAVTFLAIIAGWVLEGDETVGTAAWIAYAVAYTAGGYFGIQAGFESLRKLRIDVDLLMILAAVGAALIGAPFEGALLLFLFSLSNVLQDYALDRTRSAIRSLIDLRPQQALVRRSDGNRTLPIEEIAVGEHIIVRPGEQIALDGKVVEGHSTVNQASLTGESIPVHKGVGDDVLAGSMNEKGGLEVEVTKRAQDSTIARMISLVEEAREQKAGTERFIDTAEQYYAGGVIVMTVLAIVIPLIGWDAAFQPTFYRAMTLMVAASPCALVISTPATVLSAIANGARRGVLFKGGMYVEQAADLRVVALDKTGTLTQGKPAVVDVWAADGRTDNLLRDAAAVEAKSEHPLAQAIVDAARARDLSLPSAGNFQSTTGRGVQAAVGNDILLIGSPAFMTENDIDLSAAADTLTTWQDHGRTAVAVAQRTAEQSTAQLIGLIAIADQIRPNAAHIVAQLKENGIDRVVMLTGDSNGVARAIAREVGVDEYYAELLPQEKLQLLKKLEQQYGPVAMIGDGVNDAPALAAATIGIAMGAAGSDVALETADVVLMADDLSKLPYIIGLSHRTKRVLNQNLVFALGVILLLIGGVLGFQLALPLSVIGHEGSTVLVSLNGLRLLGYNQP